MTSTPQGPSATSSGQVQAANDARDLVRRALKGALGSLARGSGGPYVSLVTVATAMDGTPLMLLSKLALHTQNIEADPRASLLIDGSDGAGDPLAGGRVSLMGRLQRTHAPDTRHRFLARQRDAQMYADFPDFGFFAFEIERAHFIGGFGRIVDLAANDLLLDLSDAHGLIAAETEVVAHMNADHAETLQLFAGARVAEAVGAWQMSGLDPAGFDLVCGAMSLRIPFSSRVLSADAARREFVRLAAEARARGASPAA